jgi:hypothetical protein
VRNVRMIQRCHDLRFTFEPRQPLGISGEQLRQDFDGDIAIELRVAGAVDLAHAAGPDGSEDLVRAESSAGQEGHSRLRWRRSL